MISPIDYLSKRFLLPNDWLRRLEIYKEQGTIFVGTPEVINFNAVKPLRRGIRLCRVFTYSVKPTTFAMQIFGRVAAANRIEVTEEQAKLLVNGGAIQVDSQAENGFVIIVWYGFVVGVGIYKKPVLKSCIPRFRPVD